MKKTNFYNKLIIFISIIGSIILSIKNISDGDYYRLLISLSLILIVFIPYLLNKFFKVNVDDMTISVYLTFVCLSQLIGSMFGLYNKLYYYDKIMHFISGIVSSFGALLILIKLKKFDRKSLLFNIIFILSVTFLVAGLWEIFEFLSDNTFGKDAQNVIITGVSDTMNDMISAFLGSILFIILYVYEIKNNVIIIINKYILGVEKYERKR